MIDFRILSWKDMAEFAQVLQKRIMQGKIIPLGGKFA